MFTYAGRVGLDYRPLTEKLDTSSLGTEMTIAASAGIRLGEKKQLLLGPEIFGSTTTNDSALREAHDAARVAPRRSLHASATSVSAREWAAA